VTLFIDRIEIRQQPEHKRYFLEVEARVDAGQRHKFIPVPYADGRDGMLRALAAYFDEIDPPPKPEPETIFTGGIAEELRERYPVFGDLTRAIMSGEVVETRVMTGDAAVIVAEMSAIVDALRAEAEAAGVRVDGRWGEARLRQEIASATLDNATEDAQSE
jgi:hypothetical protein